MATRQRRLLCNTPRGNWGFQPVAQSTNCKFIVRKWNYRIGHSSGGKQDLDCHRIVVFLHRWQAGNSAILQYIVVSVHFSLDSANTFSNNGSAYLPWRARGPLWRPPSGHFFLSLHSNYPSLLGYIWVVVPFWIPYFSVLCPGSPSGSSPLARRFPFSYPSHAACRTYLPPPDAPTCRSKSPGCLPCHAFALALLCNWSKGGASFPQFGCRN